MKRYGKLWDKIICMDNLRLAHQNARKGKTWYGEVRMVDEYEEVLLTILRNVLKAGNYITSKYIRFTKICGEKVREIFKLPYFPDRVVHHAIMQVLMPIFKSNLIADTYSCVPGRGLHSCAEKIKKVLKHDKAAKYCLKIDINKFYPSIDNGLLKEMLRTKFKCKPTLSLLDNIIDSTTGIPIGNYISQHLANFYLSPFDHWLKEIMRVKYYYRYCDDLVIIASCKKKLHQLRKDIAEYLSKIKLSITRKWQVFPVASRGIDFLGYRFFPGYTLLRKRIAKRYKRSMRKIATKKVKPQTVLSSYASYKGWLSHADTYRLKTKYLCPDVRDKIKLASKELKCRNPLEPKAIAIAA